MGLQQPAGKDYVQSKEYSSKLLNQVSKVREIPKPRTQTGFKIENAICNIYDTRKIRFFHS